MSVDTGLIYSGPYSRLLQWQGELTALRRELHTYPEIGFKEVRTGARIAEMLRLVGVDQVHTGIGKTGVVGVIHGRGTANGRSIGLRADMDALPMQEENSFAWKSTQPGMMHGCGHDGHMAMLIGAARYLAASRNFAGDAVLIFQPGEEGFAGARAMIEDGLFERFPVEAVYAMHNWPTLTPGTINVNTGPVMAASDLVEIVVTGRGGHGGHPELAVDPVLVAAHIITAAQSLVSRNVSPIDHAVLSLCAIHAGDPGAYSVIPRQARIAGTVRSFSGTVQTLMEQRLEGLVQSIAQAFGASASINYRRNYPATINRAPEAAFAADVAATLVGESHVLRAMAPSMGAEDFSFMLQAKPGAYIRIGQGGEGSCFLHNTRYDFNDDILPLGAALFSALVERSLPPLGNA
jgi:hippurate hydrolase